MNKKMNILIIGTLLLLLLAGCGDSQNKFQSQNLNSPRSSLTKPFSDMIYGLSKIKKYVGRGDYSSAKTIVHNLHDDFHDEILPPLAAKKGKAYANNIHEDYDELEAAIRKKNKSRINELVDVNRKNLKTIAPFLGVSLF